MAKWYNRYLEAYGKMWKNLPQQTTEDLLQRIIPHKCDNPVASVVSIAHNEDTHLVSHLQSLADNKANFPFEIIVVNNNSTDTTEELLKELGVTYYNETKKGPGHARNCGLDHARGKYYICADSDTIYPPTYVEEMVKALQRTGTACAYGFWSFLPDAQHSALGLWFYERLRDLYLRIQQVKRPELNVRGMVFAFPTDLGRKYRFRTDIIRGEDGSLALNMKQDGKLCLLTTDKVRPITGYGAGGQEGGLGVMFARRVKKAFTNFSHLITKKEKYEDEESNLIN